MTSKPFRILVVDDSAPFRRQVGGALEASGLQVVEAEDGAEGLWRARAEGVFDLILVDIHMPNLDGLSFLRQIRQLPGYAEIPVLVATSDGSRERRQDGRRAGATGWLLKPVDLPNLVQSVHAALMRIVKVTEPSKPVTTSTLAPRADFTSRPPRTASNQPRATSSGPRADTPSTSPLAARREAPSTSPLATRPAPAPRTSTKPPGSSRGGTS